MVKKLLVAMTATASAAAWAGFVTGRDLWRRWGVDASEATASLPGDDLVPDADGVDTRGIDIAAPPAAVWEWLVQMGYGRGGWYSYDQIDMNHPSADRIRPELQSLAVGDVMPTDPGGGFEVRVVDPERALVLYSDRALVQAQRGDSGAATVERESLDTASPNVRLTGAYLDKAVSGDFAASWAFVLEPRDGGTRLVERFRVRMEAPAGPSGQAKAIPAVARTLLGFGVFVMVRRQMLGIRNRSEGRLDRIWPVGAPWVRGAAAAAGPS